MEFKITDKEREQIIKELAEAPLKFTYNTVLFLTNLKPIESAVRGPEVTP